MTWGMVAFDEVQRIKDPATQLRNAVVGPPVAYEAVVELFREPGGKWDWISGQVKRAHETIVQIVGLFRSSPDAHRLVLTG